MQIYADLCRFMQISVADIGLQSLTETPQTVFSKASTVIRTSDGFVQFYAERR